MAVIARKVPSTMYRKSRDVYRGIYFQAVLLGLISFTQPGIWTALNTLGAGGQAEPYVVNAANGITFGIMFFFSPIASIIGNMIGMKWVILFGTLGYVPYSTALYCNSKLGTQWFLLFGATTCGLSAAALWQGEGSVVVGYPEVSRRRKCIAIRLSPNKLGSIISSAIQLSLNADGEAKGSISPRTYIVLVGLQCLGPPLALLISSPEKLIRKDGKKPVFTNQDRTFKSQFQGYLAQFRREEVVLLIPAFIASQWGVTYQGNYLAAYYSVRARTLAGFVVSVARGLWYLLLALFTAVWIWNLVLQDRYRKHYPGTIDWTSPKYGEGLALFILYRITYETVSIWLFWVLRTYDVEADMVALSMAILRAGESLGSALSYAIGASRSVSLMTNLIISVVAFYVSAPTTTWAAQIV
ncbi:hypothetical protein NKR23_g8131 [Pleurostoma richardsiae]|uniref:UNC93-like protein n=1 Tax=Pleurostoma richardsiae TaxID=41990 RepID=A0AA38R8T2_9PEZI|nr:hypothetical protein NKR23_g8131 [Pleurostoma richardsiae]